MNASLSSKTDKYLIEQSFVKGFYQVNYVAPLRGLRFGPLLIIS